MPDHKCGPAFRFFLLRTNDGVLRDVLHDGVPLCVLHDVHLPYTFHDRDVLL